MMAGFRDPVLSTGAGARSPLTEFARYVVAPQPQPYYEIRMIKRSALTCAE